MANERMIMADSREIEHLRDQYRRDIEPLRLYLERIYSFAIPTYLLNVKTGKLEKRYSEDVQKKIDWAMGEIKKVAQVYQNKLNNG